MTPDASEVKAFVVSSLRQRLASADIDARSIPDDFDLRARGVIDSLGFIQLIGDLEARFACSIDFSDLHPEQLTNLGVLCRHVATQIQ
jgi:acyl carrier protein